MHNSVLFLRFKYFAVLAMKPRAVYIAGKQPITEQQCQLSLSMSRVTLLYNCTHWNILFLPQPSLTCMFPHLCIFVYLFIPSLKWGRLPPQNEAAKTVCSLHFASTFWGKLSHSGHCNHSDPFPLRVENRESLSVLSFCRNTNLGPQIFSTDSQGSLQCWCNCTQWQRWLL